MRPSRRSSTGKTARHSGRGQPHRPHLFFIETNRLTLGADQNDLARQLRQQFQKLVAATFEDGFIGQQVIEPEGETVDQQAAIRRGVLFERGGQLQRLLHQLPVVRALLLMALDTRRHLLVQRLGGGDVDDGKAAVDGPLFGQGTFAGAGAAEDQFTHGLFVGCEKRP